MEQWLKRLSIVLFPFFVSYLWRLLLFKLFSGPIHFEPFLDIALSFYMFMESNPVDFSFGNILLPTGADSGASTSGDVNLEFTLGRPDRPSSSSISAEHLDPHYSQSLLDKILKSQRLKSQLGDLLLPILEEQSKKLPLLERVGTLPSPLSFVDELIKDCASKNVQRGNGPNPTCHEVDCLNLWLKRRYNSLISNQQTPTQKEHETAISFFISRKLHKMKEEME